MDDLGYFLTPGALANRVREVYPAQSPGHCAVGLLIDGRISTSITQPGSDPDVELPYTGCVTKLLTAALVRRAVEAGMFTLDSLLSEYLRPAGFAHILESITVRHLLEHTHGLDDSGLSGAARGTDGFLDLQRLCGELSRHDPVAPPGRFYSYGNSGAWICAALLEKMNGAWYSSLLQKWLTTGIPGSCTNSESAPDVVGMQASCAAEGGDLRISITKLLYVLESQMPALTAFYRPNGTLSATALSGWHSLERGILLGWKVYDDGWLGHNSEYAGGGLLVRLNPTRRIGVVIASRRHSPGGICARVFGRCLAELGRLQMPQLLEHNDSIRDEWLGVYYNARSSAQLTRLATRALSLRLTDRDPAASATVTHTVSLRAAQNDVLFLDPPLPGVPYIQFLRDSCDGGSYLWNGAQLLGRRNCSYPAE